MARFYARVLVVLKAAPTWLVALSTVVTIVASEVDIPAVAEWSVKVVGWLGVAVAIIRRVTPVLPAERGLLPVEEQ